jgi:hypothetical protein
MPRRKSAFLVNVWFETGEPDAPAAGVWRGSVEHLDSGRRLYFNEIASLVGFISIWLARREAD